MTHSPATPSASNPQPAALPSALLGTQSHQMRWLFAMSDTGSVLSAPPLAAVPMACPWFVGLAAVHNQLYSVIDFSLFSGGAPVEAGNARLMLLGGAAPPHTALLFGQISGIRADSQFHAAADAPDAPWIQACWQDSANNLWQQVNLPALIGHPRFLAAAADLESPVLP